MLNKASTRVTSKSDKSYNHAVDSCQFLFFPLQRKTLYIYIDKKHEKTTRFHPNLSLLASAFSSSNKRHKSSRNTASSGSKTSETGGPKGKRREPVAGKFYEFAWWHQKMFVGLLLYFIIFHKFQRLELFFTMNMFQFLLAHGWCLGFVLKSLKVFSRFVWSIAISCNLLLQIGFNLQCLLRNSLRHAEAIKRYQESNHSYTSYTNLSTWKRCLMVFPTHFSALSTPPLWMHRLQPVLQRQQTGERRFA